MRRRSLPLPLLAVAAVVAVACPSRDELPPLDPLEEEALTPETRRPEVAGAVTILTDVDGALLEPALRVVRVQHPDLSVTVVTAGSDAIAERAAGVDLLLLHGPRTARAASAGAGLQPLDEELLERVDPRFRGLDGKTVALSVRAQVIVAKRLMANRPLSILDLGEGRWLGKIARPPAGAPMFRETIAVSLADHGEAKTGRFLGGLRANTRGDGAVVADAAAAVLRVSRREASLAVVDHVAFHRHVLPDFDPGMSRVTADGLVAEAGVELLLPDRQEAGVPWSASVGAVPAGGSPLHAHAVLFALLSREGQEAWAGPRREYPVLDDLPGPPGTPPRGDLTWSAAGLADRAEWVEDAAYLADRVDAEKLEVPTPEPGAPPEPGAETATPAESAPSESD